MIYILLVAAGIFLLGFALSALLGRYFVGR